MKKTGLILLALSSTLLFAQQNLNQSAQNLDKASQRVLRITERLEYGNPTRRQKIRLKNSLNFIIRTAKNMKAQLGLTVTAPIRIKCSNESSDKMQNTFIQIKKFAYSGKGLNLSSLKSTTYAQDWVNQFPCNYANDFMANFVTIKNVAYNGSGFNMSSAESIKYASKHVHNFCANYPLASEVSNHYNFAYSASGLNMSSTEARNYAQQKVEPFAFNCPKRF